MAKNAESEVSAIKHLTQVFATSLKEIKSKLDFLQTELETLKTSSNESLTRIGEIETKVTQLNSELTIDNSAADYTELTAALEELQNSSDSEAKAKPTKKRL